MHMYINYLIVSFSFFQKVGEFLIVISILSELQPRMRGWLLGSVDGEKMGIVPANYLKLLGKRKGRKHENQPQLGVTQSTPTQSGVSQSQSSHENLNNAFGDQENSNFLQEETYESAFGSQDTQPKTAEDFLGENELGD